jgi:hypothetical protein
LLFNEYVEDFFNSKELNNVERNPMPQDSTYNSLSSNIENPYDSDSSKILEFSIKGNNEGETIAKLSGIVDYTHSQFVIKKLDVNEEEDIKDLLGRLINSAIVNLETTQPDIDTIYWRINKANSSCIYAAMNKGFVVQDTNTFSVELVYYMASSSVRQSYNTRKVMEVTDKMAHNSSLRSV